MNVLEFAERKKQHEKISMLTCYDYWSAKILNTSPVDVLLVGDSLAMVMHGHSTTLPISTDLMATHVQAVSKGAPDKFIVGDLPFLSYRKDLTKNVEAVQALMQAGAHAVKLEGVDGNEELIQHLVKSGVPVMGHLGLTPQSVNTMGGFRVQGRAAKQQDMILEQAQRLQSSGCFSLVLECVPSPLARKITEQLRIPTIGIGAGPDTDGQVLVLQDMLGMNNEFKPKFLRKFFDGHSALSKAFGEFDAAVKKGTFPNLEESYE